MRILLVVSILFLIEIQLLAQEQNLVPNPSFDEYECIPPKTNEMECCKYWFNASSNTPDYCHKLSPTSVPFGGGDNPVSIPKTWLGFQEPYIGDAYVQIHTYFKDKLDYETTTEFVGTKLEYPLYKGEKYNVEIVFSHCDFTKYYVNGLGILFSKDSVLHNWAPEFFVQNNYIDDSIWHKETGEFIAGDTFNYLRIGNYLQFNDPRLKVAYGNGYNTDIGSYFIDFVGVYHVLDRPYPARWSLSDSGNFNAKESGSKKSFHSIVFKKSPR